MTPSRYRGLEKTQKEINEVLDKIRAEMADLEIIDYDYEGYYQEGYCKAITDVSQIIDKYRTGSNETQTNEIVYDIGGHMYGAMGGDVIMDILAGKGKE